MPTPESYKHLTEDELRERLAVAEAACLLAGWSAPLGAGTPGANAAVQAWIEWAHHVPEGFTSPAAHPDLNERRVYDLATTRAEIRERTLSKIAELTGRPRGSND